MGGFRQTQPTTIDAAQESASAQIALGADGQKLFDLSHAVKPRHASRTAGSLDTVEQRFNVLSEELAVEGAHGIDGQVDGGRSLLALGD